MLIGIDGNEANVSHRVGIGRYGLELLKHLYNKRNSESKEENVNFSIFLKEPPLDDLPKETVWWQYQVIKPRTLWTQIGLPVTLFLKRVKPEVFFTPSHYAPRFSSCPRVVSIMDLSYIYFPDMFKKKDLYQLKSWTAYSLRKTKKVLTISKCTKNDIINYYRLPEDKVVVTYPGYDKNKFKVPAFAKASAGRQAKLKDKEVLRKYNITSEYVLYVGTLQPRKNLIRLIKAFNLLVKIKQDAVSKGSRLQLVIVGKKGWLYERIFKKVKELGIEKQVVFTGFVNDADLPFLYQDAACFVLPSLYEGFGLTVIEAMASGCPVVISNVSSLPEIAADAAIKVDPKNTTDIAEGIRKCLAKNMRKKLFKKGLLRVKMFSWEKCAQKTYSILKEVARGYY